MNTKPRWALAALPLALSLAACGGGSSGGGTSAGIALPSEISAVPAREEAGPVYARLASAAGGDFAAARTVRFVDERALAQFDILNTIFGAVSQTHYAEPANVGTGPYAAVVSWTENSGDREEKRLVRWVVDSQLVSVEGQAVNRVKVWFFDTSSGALRVIKVVLNVYQAPTRNADGTYADYGVWTLNARLSDDGSQYFAASADHAGGPSRVMVNQSDRGGARTRGILLRADGQGYGKVTYPDWQLCNASDCVPPTATVAYVYDDQHVALQKGGDTLFKSRVDTVDWVRRYGLYDAASGADVTLSRSFGFPLRYTAGGLERYGYYGAWQGRHQIWADGNGIAPGVTVRRGDRDGSTQAYTTSPLFQGVLTRRTYAASSVDELIDLTVNTWVGQGARARFDGTQWTACLDPAWTGGPEPTCSWSGVVTPADFFRARSPETVNLNRWNPQAGTSQNLIHDGSRFWVATSGTPPAPTGTEWVPQAGDELWVNRSGPIWLEFDGTDWWKRSVVSFDSSTGTPSFGDPADDTLYPLVQGRDYGLDSSGVHYVVRRTAGGHEVKIERQQVPNPVDAATVVPDGLRFRRSWGGDTASTFQYGTDPALPGFLQLTYDLPGTQDAAAGRHHGDLVDEGIWNLAAELAGSPTGEAYSWEYSGGDQGYGTQQYLLLGGDYLVLDDPIRLSPITLAGRGGPSRSYALQFDGSWLGGLPDIQALLRTAGGDMTDEIAAQVVNVPDGQEVADVLDPGQRYLFRPLQISQFLLPVADPGTLELAPATDLDLASVPAFADPGMGAPPDAPLRYSEGVPID